MTRPVVTESFCLFDGAQGKRFPYPKDPLKEWAGGAELLDAVSQLGRLGTALRDTISAKGPVQAGTSSRRIGRRAAGPVPDAALESCRAWVERESLAHDGSGTFAIDRNLMVRLRPNAGASEPDVEHSSTRAHLAQ